MRRSISLGNFRLSLYRGKRKIFLWFSWFLPRDLLLSDSTMYYPHLDHCLWFHVTLIITFSYLIGVLIPQKFPLSSISLKIVELRVVLSRPRVVIDRKKKTPSLTPLTSPRMESSTSILHSSQSFIKGMRRVEK